MCLLRRSATRKHSLIFVLEQEGQLTGSDCCGKLEGDWRYQQGTPVFVEQRRLRESFAPLFLTAKSIIPKSYEILQVDPRNLFFLMPRIAGDLCAASRITAAGVRALLGLYRHPAVLVDGCVVFSGRVPNQDEWQMFLEHLVEKERC